MLSQPAEVRRTLDAIVQHLRDGDIPKDRIADAQIVLGEVLNNIVEHAYDGAAGEAILIDLWLTHAEIRCRIRDHGRPMPYGRLPSPTPPDPSRPRSDGSARRRVRLAVDPPDFHRADLPP
ncbi:anti-sigma B factor, putative [Roseibacterium elongatum DSM 19469]|uniref:Anti-sigma B factor, putative n=1 Tax=Roseicyclus elongatus DSM 19469 TaxID=1294273 RepID=W8RQ99_9RHOB|nr:anti-sigma B factor, putative [Roseibacterium elongatum DSM 19469]